MTPMQAAQRAVELLGGPVKAARLLRVKDERYQTVQSWIANRVPAEYCPLIERETEARGEIILCEQLRPDVLWSVLRLRTGNDDPPELISGDGTGQALPPIPDAAYPANAQPLAGTQPSAPMVEASHAG